MGQHDDNETMSRMPRADKQSRNDVPPVWLPMPPQFLLSDFLSDSGNYPAVYRGFLNRPGRCHFGGLS
jgi:hypothetical protein